MTTDIANIGFTVDTRPLVELNALLQQVARNSAPADAALAKLAATTRTAFANMPAILNASLGAASGTGGGSALSSLVPQQERLQDVLGRTKKSLDEATKSHQSHGAAAQNATLAMLEMTHVGRSLFDVIASGGNPLRGLAMEFGRIQIGLKAMSESSGGVAGFFSDLGEKVGGFVNPLTLGIGAIAGFGSAALLAASHVHDLRDEMDRAVGGAGRMTGLSGAMLNELATRPVALEPFAGQTLSVADSRESAMALARSGRLDPANIRSAMGLVPGYAGLTGSSLGESGEKLAAIFSDPTRGLGELQKAIGALDVRTRQTVISLQAQGDANAAVRVLIDATSTSLKEMVKPQGPWDRFSKWWSDRNAQVEHLIAGEVAPDPALQYLRASRAGGGPGMLGALQARGVYDDGTGNLAEDMRHSAMLRGAGSFMLSEADTLTANQQSASAGDIIRGLIPELGQRQHLLDQRSSLTRALDNPDARKLIDPAAASAASEALDRLNTNLATLKTGLQRLVEEGDLSVRQTLARTASERAAIDIERAYVSTLDRTHSALEAAQAAENKRNDAIAASTRTALDALRATSDRASLVGLNSYDRMMRENDLRFRDLQERTITGPVLDGTAMNFGPTRPVQPSAASATPEMITAAAAQTGLPAAIIAAIGQVENGGRLGGRTGILDATGRPASSAYGFGQITTGAEADIRRVLPGFDRTDPSTEVMGSATYLKELLERNHGDLRAALGSYSGPDPRHDGSGNAAWIANVLRTAGGGIALPSTASGPVLRDTGSAALANRLNYAVGRQADVSDLLMSGPTETNTRIEAQLASLKAQQEAVGQSAGAMAAAAEKQREWNDVTATGVTQQKMLAAFGQAGTRMWSELTAKISDNASAMGRLAEEQDRVRKVTQGMDALRGDASDLFGGILKAGAHGTSISASLHSSLSRIEDQLLDRVSGSLTSSLFGQAGGSGGGLFGGGLGSIFSSLLSPAGFTGSMPHFASGTSDFAQGGPALVGEQGPEIVNLPRHAEVVPAGPTAAMLGGGQGGGPVTVNVHNAPGTPSVTTTRGPNGHTINLDFQLDQALTRMADKNTRGFQAFSKRMGQNRVG